MRYVLINPYPSARRNGITTYLQHLERMVESRGLPTARIDNEEHVRRPEFQQRVRDEIIARFRPDEVLIEAPEVGSATLLVPPEYRVHVRLHCPSAFVQRHNALPVGEQQFANEISVIRTAHVASCPSYGLLRELAPHVDVAGIHVYKNPPPAAAPVRTGDKTHDVVFMGNFTRLKGIDFVNPLLRRLPSGYSVAMVGRYSEDFALAGDVRCRVSVGAHLPGAERLALLAGARVALSLSRFENCSMLVLEALAVGTLVAGWRVGGHPEIAGERLVRLVPLGDVDALAAVIVAAVEGAYPAPEEFGAATAAVDDDFRQGWSHVWSVATGGASSGVYRGLDHAARAA